MPALAAGLLDPGAWLRLLLVLGGARLAGWAATRPRFDQPLLWGLLGGALGGDPGIGFLVGVPMAALLGGRGPTGSGLACVAAGLGAVWARPGALGGFLLEGFLGIAVALAAAGHRRAPRAGTVVAVWAIGAAALAAIPEVLRSAAPWLSGVPWTVAVGRRLRQSVRPAALGGVVAALAVDLGGPLGLPALLLPWRRVPRSVRAGLAVLALGLVGWRLSWVPYALPAWDGAWLPGPPGTGRLVADGPSRAARAAWLLLGALTAGHRPAVPAVGAAAVLVLLWIGAG